EVQLIATSLLIIDKGRKVAEGAATTLLNPADTLVLLETENDAASRAWLAGSAWARVLTDLDEGLLLKVDRHQVAALNADLVAQGIRVLRLEPRQSLEDYFLRLTSSAQHVVPFTH